MRDGDRIRERLGAAARRRPWIDAHQLDRLLTLTEVAAVLRVHVRTIRRLVANRRIPCVRIGRSLRFDPADVSRFVAARKE